MNNLNYIFFEEFKRLDKLCGEMYGAKNGVTCYIDDMKAVPELESRSISNWQSDLRKLIYFRHIRNNLAHEEGAFLEKACTQDDIDWVQAFYQRILEQADPIALKDQRAKEKEQALGKKHVNSKMNQNVFIDGRIASDYSTFNKVNNKIPALVWISLLIGFLVIMILVCVLFMFYY